MSTIREAAGWAMQITAILLLSVSGIFASVGSIGGNLGDTCTGTYPPCSRKMCPPDQGCTDGTDGLCKCM